MFRTLANEMQFWYKEKELDSADLIRVPRKMNPGTYDPDDWEEVEITNEDSEEGQEDEEESDNKIRLGLRAQGFLKVLFKDKHLVQCLARRVHWRFKDTDTLPIFMEHVPSFKDLISITLGSKRASPYHGDRGPPVTQKTISLLSTCHHLTSLEFPDEFQTTDLEFLSKTYPQLKHLIIHRTQGFTGTFTGSSLEELDIRGGLSLSFYEGEFHNMFPLSSAASLTQLLIIYSEGNGADDAATKGLFDAFINLNSFCISPMSNGISDFLIRTNICTSYQV
jgi:hypothetical protein